MQDEDDRALTLCFSMISAQTCLLVQGKPLSTSSTSAAWFSGSCAQQCLEIGAGALRLGACRVGGFAKAEIAVDQAFTRMVLDRHVGGLERRRIGCAFVAQGIEPGGTDDRWRKSCMILRPQRRDTPVPAMAFV